MSVINNGTITITQGLGIITGVDTKFLSKNIKAGWLLYPDGYPDPYHILLDATSETSLTLLETHNGVTESLLDYEIIADYYDYNVPALDPNMTENVYKINFAHQRIIDALNSLGAASTQNQIFAKKYIGVPVQDNYFGYQKFTGASIIKKIILSSQDGETTENNLVLDIEINGVLQGLNLTVPAGASTITSAVLAYNVAAGQAMRLKWITAVVPCSSNWDIDIHYSNSSGLKIYYDFQKIYFGYLYVNLILGASYKPPSKNRVFGITYELDEAANGASIILELLKNAISLATPVLITIPADSLNGYLEMTQTEFLTTDICSLKVNQIGSNIPGSNLRTILHSFHVT